MGGGGSATGAARGRPKGAAGERHRDRGGAPRWGRVGARGGRGGATRGGGEEGEGRRRGRGELTSGTKSGNLRLQNLGHHEGEREVGEGGSCCAGELNEGNDQGEGQHGEG
jgi:hypothetical protein